MHLMNKSCIINHHSYSLWVLFIVIRENNFFLCWSLDILFLYISYVNCVQRYLMSKGADIFAAATTNKNVLHYAAESGNMDVLNLLTNKLEVCVHVFILISYGLLINVSYLWMSCACSKERSLTPVCSYFFLWYANLISQIPI